MRTHRSASARGRASFARFGRVLEFRRAPQLSDVSFLPLDRMTSAVPSTPSTVEPERLAFLDELQAHHAPESVELVQRVLDQLVAWSERNAKLVRHHAGGGEPGTIVYRLTRSGYVGWAVIPGAGDDARLELLPRVAAMLAPAVQTELRSRLAAIKETALDGMVPTVPLLALGEPEAMKGLLATLDWVLPHTNERV